MRNQQKWSEICSTKNKENLEPSINLCFCLLRQHPTIDNSKNENWFINLIMLKFLLRLNRCTWNSYNEHSWVFSCNEDSIKYRSAFPKREVSLPKKLFFVHFAKKMEKSICFFSETFELSLGFPLVSGFCDDEMVDGFLLRNSFINLSFGGWSCCFFFVLIFERGSAYFCQ